MYFLLKKSFFTEGVFNNFGFRMWDFGGLSEIINPKSETHLGFCHFMTESQDDKFSRAHDCHTNFNYHSSFQNI